MILGWQAARHEDCNDKAKWLEGCYMYLISMHVIMDTARVSLHPADPL